MNHSANPNPRVPRPAFKSSTAQFLQTSTSHLLCLAIAAAPACRGSRPEESSGQNTQSEDVAANHRPEPKLTPLGAVEGQKAARTEERSRDDSLGSSEQPASPPVSMRTDSLSDAMSLRASGAGASLGSVPSEKSGLLGGPKKREATKGLPSSGRPGLGGRPSPASAATNSTLRTQGPRIALDLGDRKLLPSDEEAPSTYAETDANQPRPNEPTRTAADALSTFAIDVDTAGYAIARRSILAGQRPAIPSVCVEEFVNYFDYDYEAPKAEGGGLFSIEVDGARSPVQSNKRLLRVGIQARRLTEETRRPMNLIFLVDTSGSMSSDDKLALAKKSILIALEHLGPRDRIGIATYAGNTSVVLQPTLASETAKITRAVSTLESGGGTAMSSGMDLAYGMAARALSDDSLSRVIVMSDGDANIGASSPIEILKRIEGYVKEGVTLSTIGYGTGNYRDDMMETLADKGNGNYYYVDSPRQAERVFGTHLLRMLQDVAQDVKIQVEFDKASVESYRLVGYENRDVADKDFRDDRKDGGEIGAGHSVTALYELTLSPTAAPSGELATIRVRAKKPRGTTAKETALSVLVRSVDPSFEAASQDFQFATAVMEGAEILRSSPYASGWTLARVAEVAQRTTRGLPERKEFVHLMRRAEQLIGGQLISRSDISVE